MLPPNRTPTPPASPAPPGPTAPTPKSRPPVRARSERRSSRARGLLPPAKATPPSNVRFGEVPSAPAGAASAEPSAPAGAGQASSAEPSAPAGSPAGRLMIYSANFGTIAGNAVWGPAGMRSLQSIPGHILLGQEMDREMWMTLHNGGWQLTDPAYAPAGSRTRYTPQMLVAMWPTHCKRIDTLYKPSFSLFAAEEKSTHCLFARVEFRWLMAGFPDLAVGSFHLHRNATGMKSPHFKEFVKKLAEGIRASGARVIGGDANKALFFISPALREHGIEATLMCQHIELDPTKQLYTDSEAKLQASVRYDTCGIWLLGPHGVCKPLSGETRLILGAMHAFYLERTDKGQRYNIVPRGFPAETFGRDEPLAIDEVHRVLTAILRIWQAHEVQKLSNKVEVWRFVFENMEVPPPPQTPPPGSSTPAPSTFAPAGSSSSTPAPAGPSAAESATSAPAGSPSAGTAATRTSRSLRPYPGPASAKEFVALPMAPDIEDGDTTSWGESVSFQMQRLGLARYRGRLDASAPAGLDSDTWPPLPLAHEVPASGEKWDPTGGVWNRAGHWPLMLSLGDLRTRSAEGKALRNIRNEKKRLWRASGEKSWPWWVDHESERTYWQPGGPSTGRGFSGYWWRWSQAGLTQQEARRRDQAWVDLYGEEAYSAALAATQWVLGLPYPPSSAPAGSDTDLLHRAASGEPELWPAHMAAAPTGVTALGRMLAGSTTGAVPTKPSS